MSMAPTDRSTSDKGGNNRQYRVAAQSFTGYRGEHPDSIKSSCATRENKYYGHFFSAADRSGEYSCAAGWFSLLSWSRIGSECDAPEP